MEKGNLYLIPSFLAETNTREMFSVYNLNLIYALDVFIVENLRTTRRFLRKLNYDRSFDDVVFYELNKHTEPQALETYLQPALQGRSMGLISEAGSPCIADPGAAIVEKAHQQGIRVVPLIGPSSILLALIASGFNGQNFAFNGYLPIDKKQRDQKIRELETKIREQRQTQIFMETPYRNNAMIASLLAQCRKDTLLCIASELTHEKWETIQTRTIADWKKKIPDFHKKTCIFLMYS